MLIEIVFTGVFTFVAIDWSCYNLCRIYLSIHKQDLNRLNHKVVKIQENNEKLLIFLEGTRSQNVRLLPFKKGIFHIAIQNI